MNNEHLQSPVRGNAAERYGWVAMALHWLMFLLVVGVGILGLLHDSWPKRSQAFWINLHAAFGVLLWFTLLARIWWRKRGCALFFMPKVALACGDAANTI